MNQFCFKKEKVDELVRDIRKGLIENKSILQKAFDLDLKEWEFQVDLNKMLEIVDSFKDKEYLPKFSKEKIVDGFGKIALVSNQNPYLILNFILSALYTNNKVEVVLENKLQATNRVMVETIKKVLAEKGAEEDTVSYLELVNSDEIVSKQDNYDLIYYFGNKEAYLSFIKRMHVDTRFEEFGEINVYFDSEDFKEQMLEINRWAYFNEYKVNIRKDDINKVISEFNMHNNISKLTVIFSKNIENVAKFSKEIKSEKIFVNINPVELYKTEIDPKKLVYTKIIKW